MATGPTRRDGTWIYRLGGAASLAIALAYVAITALYASVGAPPTGGTGEEWLSYLAGRTAAWWWIVGLSVLTNLLYVPVALSLYLALRRFNRVAMLIGVAFVGLFVILENAVNWTSYGALLVLSESVTTVGTADQQASVAAAATAVAAVLASPLAAVWAIGTLSFGFLVIGLVMLRGVFNRATAYLGILTGVLGAVAVAGVGAAVILNALCATGWLVLVGYGLLTLEPSSTAPGPDPAPGG